MTDELRIALADALIYAAAIIGLPDDIQGDIDAIKANMRDKREPGRLRKMRDERKMKRFMDKVFARQAGIVRRWLEDNYSSRKADIPGIDWEAEEEDELIRILTVSALEGINLFGDQINISFDKNMTNKEAAAWAKKYAGQFIKEIDNTTRDRLRTAISDFADTEGMTIADVMDVLPFDEERSRTIAITEITRAYGEANQLGANELAREFPDVTVTKTWFTNNDDLVCPICAPLDGQTVEYDSGWGEGGADDPEGILQPPAHVNCRCWTSFTTNL